MAHAPIVLLKGIGARYDSSTLRFTIVASLVGATAEDEVAANKLKLGAQQIIRLTEPMGGCIATNRIMYDGMPVGTMVRDIAADDDDSGWLFLAGDESQEYLDDARNLAVYDVNTVANYDPSIIPYLYALPGQCFDRDPRTHELAETVDSAPDSRGASLPPGVAVVQGRVLLSEDWHLELPTPFRRRREHTMLVLWRPALTFRIEVVDHEASSALRFVEGALAEVPRHATDHRRSERAHVIESSFRLRSASAPCSALHSFSVGPQSYVHVEAFFDRESEVATARAVIDTLRVAEPFGLH